MKASFFHKMIANICDCMLLLTLMFGLYLLTGIHIHLHLFVFIPLVLAVLLLKDSLIAGKSPGKYLLGLSICAHTQGTRMPLPLAFLLHNLTLGFYAHTAILQIRTPKKQVWVPVFLLLTILFLFVLLHFPLGRMLANEFCCSNNDVVTRF